MWHRSWRNVFFTLSVSVSAAACGGGGGSPGSPSPVVPGNPGARSCEGPGRPFEGAIALRDDTHGGPTSALRPDEASGRLCVVVEVLTVLTGRDIRVTGWMTVDGETQVLPPLLETLDVNGFASHDIVQDGPRSAWLFRRPSCGATEMTQLLVALGEASVEASESMFITEDGTSAACGDYAVDARLSLAE